MEINKELLKGSTQMMILKLLETEDLYGYKMIKKLSEKSQNIFNLKEGTLYPILHELEKSQLVETYWENTESTRKRKYYKITSKGKKALKKKKVEWDRYIEGINNLFMEVRCENV